MVGEIEAVCDGNANDRLVPRTIVDAELVLIVEVQCKGTADCTVGATE
jgi:hypothetical protein